MNAPRSSTPERISVDRDRTGTITNETFQRAFPEWRSAATLDWSRNRWGSSLGVRYVDELLQPSENVLDFRIYVDLQGRYTAPFWQESMTVAVGIDSILD